MFFSKIYLSALFAGLFLLFGCTSSEPVKYPLPDAAEQLRLDQRTGALKEKISPFRVRGITLDQNTIRLRDTDFLVKRLQKMGFNRVFLSLKKGDMLKGAVSDFTGRCNRTGIEVYAVLQQADAVSKPSSNLFMRKFSDEKVTLASVAKEFAEQNRELPAEQQLKGFMLAVAPHLFTPANPFRPSGCLYSWDKNRFGSGLDNEALIHYSIREVEEASRLVAPLPVMVQLPDFYYGLTKAGKLPAGILKKFSLSGSKPRELVLLNSGNKPSELFLRVEAELKERPAEIPLLIAVNLAPHTAVTKGELRRRNWNDLVRSIGYAAGRYQSSRNIAGLVLGPCDRIELLLEEK